MITRRVFVMWLHPLFHDSMRRLLNHPGIEWVGAASDHTAARRAIADLRPDTILVEAGEGEGLSADALEILQASAPEVRVMRLSLADNALDVYHREQRVVARVEDLLRLIQED